jgi:two-component system, NtrC family, C4-dicarboxylate transport sensor histidine kinase DctB
MDKELTTLQAEIDQQCLAGMNKITSSLSKNQYVENVANGNSSIDNEKVLNSLETIKQVTNASIVYVMNITGTVVASTIYNHNQSLTGNNYQFRSYFQQAMRGNQSVYPALGVTTLERGIYFSSPIQKNNGDSVVGVVVIKKGLEALDLLLQTRQQPTMVISPEGIIFSSNRENLFHSLTPLSKESIQSLLESKQFAGLSISSLNYTFDDDTIQIFNQSFFYAQKPFDVNGWSMLTYETEPGILFFQKQSNTGFFHLPLTILLFAFLFISLFLYDNIHRRKKVETKLKKANYLVEYQRKTLQEQVDQQTKVLREKIDELQTFKKVTVGRELRMAELKKQIKKLEENRISETIDKERNE